MFIKGKFLFVGTNLVPRFNKDSNYFGISSLLKNGKSYNPATLAFCSIQ